MSDKERLKEILLETICQKACPERSVDSCAAAISKEYISRREVLEEVEKIINKYTSTHSIVTFGFLDYLDALIKNVQEG